MSTTPPPAFGYWAITIQTTGSGHLSVITCGFANPTPATASYANGLLRTSMGSTNNPFLAANMQIGFTVINTYVLINTGAGLYVDNNTATISGSAVSTAPPLNTALIVKKNTIFAGRQYRGRMMVPPFGVNEGDISIAGVIGGTTLSNNQTRWNNFYTSLVSNNLQPVLLHSPPKVGTTPAPTNISSFSITPLIGSIKRRIRN